MPKLDAFYCSVRAFFNKMKRAEESPNASLRANWVEIDDETHLVLLTLVPPNTPPSVRDKLRIQKEKNLNFLGSYFSKLI